VFTRILKYVIKCGTNVRFEVLMMVKFHFKAFWVVMLCGVVVGYQCFRGPCCLHLHPEGGGRKVFCAKGLYCPI
jgi:hypothetical protein